MGTSTRRARPGLASSRQVATASSAVAAATVNHRSVTVTARARAGSDRTRNTLSDTIGLLLTVLVTAAGVQDRDGARPLLWNLRQAFRTVKQVWADSGYVGKLVTWAQTSLRLRLQIVRRTELHKFIVLPRRWVVERTFSWITRSRRTVRDYERLPAHHETIVYWSMIIIMSRRLARHNQSHQLHPT